MKEKGDTFYFACHSFHDFQASMKDLKHTRSFQGECLTLK